MMHFLDTPEWQSESRKNDHILVRGKVLVMANRVWMVHLFLLPVCVNKSALKLDKRLHKTRIRYDEKEHGG